VYEREDSFIGYLVRELVLVKEESTVRYVNTFISPSSIENVSYFSIAFNQSSSQSNITFKIIVSHSQELISNVGMEDCRS